MERGICPIATLAFRLTLYLLTGSRDWPLGSLDVISHVTIGTADDPFLLVGCWCQVTISHGCRDIEPQTLRGHDLDPFGSRDVIGHMTIGTADGRFLLVIHWHHVSISPTVAEILSIKHFGVMTLTLSGHVTSSVTWPLEPQMVVSYWSSIDTMSLSPTGGCLFGDPVTPEKVTPNKLIQNIKSFQLGKIYSRTVVIVWLWH